MSISKNSPKIYQNTKCVITRLLEDTRNYIIDLFIYMFYGAFTNAYAAALIVDCFLLPLMTLVWVETAKTMTNAIWQTLE